MKIGDLIHQQRKAKGLTLEDVGKYCDVPRSTVCRWENGKIKKISRENQEALCILLDIDPVIFFRREEVLTPEEYEMIVAFREADERARADALSMLIDHKVKKERSLAI